MSFDFYPLRFDFIARDSLFFPSGKAANVLRGALGTVFRRIACLPHCRDSRNCEIRTSCPYASVFEPVANGAAPSGLADCPRPFVFRARHLDGCVIERGTSFHFDLNVFSVDPAVLAYFVLTFSALARDGLGPGRGRTELRCVRRLACGGLAGQMLYNDESQTIQSGLKPASLDLRPCHAAPHRVRIEFLSPTELKHEHKIAPFPEFPILFGRVRDRISTLRSLYGPGPLQIDFRGISERASAVRMIRCALRRRETARRSSRTGLTHSIGGFVGEAEYEGDLREFLSYLKAARWTGVGRQAVWGKGEITVSPTCD